MAMDEVLLNDKAKCYQSLLFLHLTLKGLMVFVERLTFLLANCLISITSMGYAAFLVTGLKVREGRRAANTSL